jgi:hypothetical protein
MEHCQRAEYRRVRPYRSENPDGPFIKINPSLIPASSDPLAGNQYSYQDEQVLPGKLYYYQLEELEMSGGSNRFGPISVRASGGSAMIVLVLITAGLLALLGATWVFSRNRARQAKGTLPASATGL